MFLVTVLRSLKTNLLRRLDESGSAFLSEYYQTVWFAKQRVLLGLLTSHQHLPLFTQCVDHLVELHWFVYKNAATRILNYDAMVQKVTNSKWDQKEIATEHSEYVNSLVQDVVVLHGRLQSLGEKRVPAKAAKTLWTEVLNLLNRIFIEG